MENGQTAPASPLSGCFAWRKPAFHLSPEVLTFRKARQSRAAMSDLEISAGWFFAVGSVWYPVSGFFTMFFSLSTTSRAPEGMRMINPLNMRLLRAWCVNGRLRPLSRFNFHRHLKELRLTWAPDARLLAESQQKARSG